MFESIVTIVWPAGEPCWFEVVDDVVVFGDVDLVRNLENDDCGHSAINLIGSKEFWPRIDARDNGWLVGRDPGLLAPSVGVIALNGKIENLIVIWELVDADDDFVLPSEIILPPGTLRAPIVSKQLETGNRQFRLFPANELWGGVEARSDFPVFFFSGIESDLNIFEIELIRGGFRGRFLLHVISRGFDRCIWDV